MACDPVPEEYPEPGPDVTAFRTAMGHFVTGITVVTATVDGVDHAMTANSFTSVSLDPLLVLVCVEKDARFHEAILAAGTWAVSVLDAGAREAAVWFATRGRPLLGQLGRYPHRDAPVTRTPVFRDAIAWMDCRTWAVYDGGDHDIVVGEVVALATPHPETDPLVYHRGRYGRLGAPG
jgi:flavin reductase